MIELLEKSSKILMECAVLERLRRDENVGIKILGGCCGTDTKYLKGLAHI